MELVERPSFTIAGITLRTSNARAGEIGPFWGRALAARLHERAGVAPGRLVAAYTDYENAHHGEYTLLVGVETAAAVDGLRSLVVPAGTYARFEARGPAATAVPAAWARIWAECARRRYDVDVEIYDDARPERVEIFVGVS